MRTVVHISGRDGDCALSVDCAADDAQKRIVSVLAYKPNGTMALIALIGAAFSGCIRDAASGYRADCKEWGDYAISLRPYRAVDKIFGSGNLFVTLAKRQVYGVVGIDGLAGPTETVVVADEAANPTWVAADLLAQAEHDLLASAILLTPSQALIDKVQLEVAHQLEQRNRSEIIAASLENRGGAVLTRDLEEAVQLANEYAPEHLGMSVSDPWRWVEKVPHAGGVFVGEHSFEVLGDYLAGPSHVMPTGGSARFASPLNVWDFVKIVSLVALDEGTAQARGPEREGLRSPPLLGPEQFRHAFVGR